MGSRGDSILWQNTMNNLQGMAMQYGQLKARDQQMKFEQGMKAFNIAQTIIDNASSDAGIDEGLKLAKVGFDTVNGMYGLNLDTNAMSQGLAADRKEALKLWKDWSNKMGDYNKGIIKPEDMIAYTNDFGTKISSLNTGSGSINDKVQTSLKQGEGLLKDITYRQKKDQVIKALDNMNLSPEQRQRAEIGLLSDDATLFRQSLEQPKPKTSLVPLYGQGGEVVYDEMGAGDKVPPGFSPRPPKEPREKDPDIAIEKNYRKVHGQVSANLRRNTQNRAIVAKMLDDEISKGGGAQSQRALSLQQRLAEFDEQIATTTNTLTQVENGEIDPSDVKFGSGAKKTTNAKPTREQAITELKALGLPATEANIKYHLSKKGK